MRLVKSGLLSRAALLLSLVLLLTTAAMGAAARPLSDGRRGSAYDGCIIGSPAVDAYDLDLLNDCTGGSFCALRGKDADTMDFRAFARHAVERCGAKTLILSLDLASTDQWATEGPGLRRTHQNRIDRDVEKIGDPRAYLRDHGADFTDGTCPMTCWQSCVASVAYIRELCRANEVDLTVLCTPVYESLWQGTDRDTMEQFKRALAQITDFWDFSHSSLSYDCRYFYDRDTFRPAVADMMLARIYGPEDRYVPEDFGLHVTRDNVDQSLERLYAAEPAPEGVCVPALMYHHLAPEDDGKTVLAIRRFEHQMAMLEEKGYHAVTLQQMVDYVRRGTPLPEKPVCITFDDGYRSNYDYAYPILEKHGLCGTIFTIGWSVGLDRYKDTDHPILPHFTWEQAREMQRSGVMNVQSHTYDMHQWAPFEDVPEDQCRRAMRQLPGESGAAFQQAVQADLQRFAALFAENSALPLVGLAYPTGAYNSLTELLVHESGIPVTFSIRNDQRNILVRGLDQSLYALCRLDVTPVISDAEILAHLNNR